MKIGITLGDPAGIGPEIILKAAPEIKNYREIFVLANKHILKKTASDFNMVNNYETIKDKIVDCVANVKFQYGRPTKKTGIAAMQSIDRALQFEMDIIITPPIVKNVIKYTIPKFVGHTEYFANFFKIKNFAMVGVAGQKKIMLLTTHLPLRDIFAKVTPEAVVQKIMLWDWGLKKYFGVKNPKIAVCALNPHAFEFSLGEDEKIRKGISMAKSKGLNAEGPYPADSIFNRNYDGFLAMYHDQAMIYLKSRMHGLNFTLGLPIIRLSPLHGAALDIAGKNQADFSGLIAAVKEGVRLFQTARKHKGKISPKF